MLSTLNHLRSHRAPVLIMLLAAALAVCFPAPAIAQDTQPVDDGPTIADGQQLLQQQAWGEAAEVFQQIALSSPQNGRAWFFLGYSRHANGQLASALAAHLVAADLGGNTAPIAMYNAACVYSLWNNSDKAFQWLHRAIDAGFNNPGQLEIDPDMDNIRNDPRFEQLPWPEGNRGANRPRAAFTRNPPERTDDQPRYDPDDPRRKLDFWLGSWRVISDGNEVARDTVKLGKGGAYLTQTWRSETLNGTSLNFFNPAKKKWEQVWVDDQGRSVHLFGEFHDDAMHYEGTCQKTDGTVTALRMKLAPEENGSVHMFIEESKDKGQSWTPFFKATYSPLSMPAKAADKDKYDSDDSDT